MSDDDGSISNIQAVAGMDTLDINADQMTPLTSLSFDGGSDIFNAETSGTYDISPPSIQPTQTAWSMPPQTARSRSSTTTWAARQ